MSADHYMNDLAKRLKSSPDLDPEMVDLIIEKLFKPDRDRDAAFFLEMQVEKIALRRSSTKRK